MEKLLNSRNFPEFVVFLLIMGNPCFGQALVATDSARMRSAELIASDKHGNIYATDERGNLYKFDPSLDTPLIYSPDVPARITSIDPWHGLRIFIFYKDIQEFTLLNRFLDSPSNYKVISRDIGFVLAATPSFDNKLWLLDQPSMSLLKYDYSNQKIEIKTPLDFLISKPFQKIILFREYQNRVYLADDKGELYIFDNLGNYLSKYTMQEAKWVGFFEDSIYFYAKGKFTSINLYTFQAETTELLLPPDSRMGIWVGDKFYVLFDDKISGYKAK